MNAKEYYQNIVTTYKELVKKNTTMDILSGSVEPSVPKKAQLLDEAIHVQWNYVNGLEDMFEMYRASDHAIFKFKEKYSYNRPISKKKLKNYDK